MSCVSESEQDDDGFVIREIITPANAGVVSTLVVDEGCNNTRAEYDAAYGYPDTLSFNHVQDTSDKNDKLTIEVRTWPAGLTLTLMYRPTSRDQATRQTCSYFTE